MYIGMFQESTAMYSELDGVAFFAGIVGLLMIAFSEETGIMMMGLFIGLFAPLLLQEDYHQEIKKQFVLERFERGDVIECALYRGEHKRLSLNRGWQREEERFVRGEEVLSDSLLCNVIGKDAPTPILWMSWIFYILYVLIAFSARAGMSDLRNNETKIKSLKRVEHE